MKINIANRQQLLAAVAIGAVALWAADKLIIGPVIGVWKTRDKHLTELQDNFKNGQKMVADQGRIRGEWNNVHANTLTNDLSLASGQVIQAIDRWAYESGTTVTSKRPQWKKGDDKEFNYNTLECGVDAQGGLESLTRFLFNIGHDPMGVKITTVDITARDNTGGQLNLALQLSFLQLGPSQIKP